MDYFRDNNGTVFAYDETQMDLVGDKIPMTNEEIELHLNPPKTQVDINAEALDYLASTDWYVVRFSETGIAIPDDVKVKRQEARASVK